VGGWGQIGNGERLTIAEAAGFDIVITADQNVRCRQHLSGRRLSFVVVSTSAGGASLLSHAPSFRAMSVSSVSILLSRAV
jgi:hypothetical protein